VLRIQILDPGWNKSRSGIWDNHPGFATLHYSHLYFGWTHGGEPVLCPSWQTRPQVNTLVEDGPLTGDAGIEQRGALLPLPPGQLTLHRELVVLEEGLHLHILHPQIQGGV
jgi:hypothetical protein